MTNFQLLVKESNKSLTEISQETGISYSTLGNYNQGTRTPKKENAKILADYFDVSVPYLLGLDDNRQILDFAGEGIAKGIIEKIKGRKTLDMLLTSTPYLEEIVDIMNDIINKKVLDKKSEYHFLWEAWEKEPRRKERLEQTRKKWKEQGTPIFKSWK